jgi:hypothetical protein
LRARECPAPDAGGNSTFIGFRRDKLAEQGVRKHYIPDFSNRKNHNTVERAFARVEKDLRASVGK